MEYNFGTETQGGSNDETNLSVSNSYETKCAALSFRVELLLSPLYLVPFFLRFGGIACQWLQFAGYFCTNDMQS